MKCVLRVKDEVNVRFEGLDPMVRKALVKKLSFMNPKARHMPSFKLGRWDGKVTFATIGGGTFYNLLDIALPVVLDAGYEVDIDDERLSYSFDFPTIDENVLAHKCWPEGHAVEGQPIILRDYQVNAINDYLENRQSISAISTGAGKTIISATLSMLCEPYGRTLVVVPSKTLVEQTEDDYRNIGLDVGVFFGDRKEHGHTHTIATWQSLSAFCKKKDEYDDLDHSFAAFIKDVNCVIIDEVHSAKAKILKDLLCGPLAHVPIRWGMTGTVPKDDYEFYNLLAAIGPVTGRVSAKSLQDKGVLSECEIDILQLDDKPLEFKDYASEFDYLVGDQKRLNWMAEFVSGLEGNTLVLVDRINTGNELQAMIGDSVFISGKMKNKERRAEFKEMMDSDGRTIVATYGTMSTGVNLPKMHNLVLIHCGKSFIRTVQSAGRILRKAPGKDRAYIFDICSNLKFDSRHLTRRKEFYRDAEYPFVVRKINYK